MPRTLRFVETSSYANATADIVAEALNAILSNKPTAVLAVPGGSTARRALPQLACRQVFWPRLKITLVDERWVPSSHPDSNEALIRSLFKDPAIPEIIGLYTATKTPAEEISKLAARIPIPDVALLGMGEDGHIASLFPGDPANASRGRFAVVQRDDHLRVTMTPTALLQANKIILAFDGAAKRQILERALHPGPADELPVRHILDRATILIGP